MPGILVATTDVLDIAYETHGPDSGDAVLLLHGFPYDVRCYDEVAPRLAAQGLRVVVPWLRGYGPTRFRFAHTMRSGQQAALGRDLLDLMDALGIERALLAGYDWGGRAACIATALAPERVRGLVSGEGYSIQDIAAAAAPALPDTEHLLWYQYYFHTPRGEAGLRANRRELCRLLWRLWSPGWAFDADTFERTAAAFDNPDFVDVVIHSYRHRFGYAEGDAAYASAETRLAALPGISVPAISLCGADDGVIRGGRDAADAAHFSGPFERRILAGVGHNLPQEAPEAFAATVFDLYRATAGATGRS